MLEATEQLDRVADQLGVRRLSSFYDWADYLMNTAPSDAASRDQGKVNDDWHSPADAISTVTALLERLATQPTAVTGNTSTLVEELQDCRKKLQSAMDATDRFHLCVVA